MQPALKAGGAFGACMRGSYVIGLRLAQMCPQPTAVAGAFGISLRGSDNEGQRLVCTVLCQAAA